MPRHKTDIVIALDIIRTSDYPITSGVGISYPDDPKRGRFHIQGIIVDELKRLLHRPVWIKLTRLEAEALVNELTEAMTKYPRTGSEVDVHTGGSDQ